jgi:hypothetical protein
LLRLKVSLKKDDTYPEYAIEAFERSMKDVCEGLLPLGGGVNRGNGYFSGVLLKNGEEI